MKLVYFFIVIFLCSTTFAQSKKEQVEMLTLRLDSLNFVLGKVNKDLIYSKNIIALKQKSIDSLELLFSAEKKNYENLKVKMDEQNSLLAFREKMLKNLQQKADSLSEIVSQKHYLDILSEGYKMTNEDNEHVSECKSDFDDDGKEDLAIILFNEESIGRVFLFLSSLYYSTGGYQSFEWVFTGNLLSDFSCQNSRLHVSGGSESQGIFQHLVLVYSRAQKLMIIDSYEDSSGGNDIQIDYIK